MFVGTCTHTYVHVCTRMYTYVRTRMLAISSALVHVRMNNIVVIRTESEGTGGVRSLCDSN